MNYHRFAHIFQSAHVRFLSFTLIVLLMALPIRALAQQGDTSGPGAAAQVGDLSDEQVLELGFQPRKDIKESPEAFKARTDRFIRLQRSQARANDIRNQDTYNSPEQRSDRNATVERYQSTGAASRAQTPGANPNEPTVNNNYLTDAQASQLQQVTNDQVKKSQQLEANRKAQAEKREEVRDAKTKVETLDSRVKEKESIVQAQQREILDRKDKIDGVKEEKAILEQQVSRENEELRKLEEQASQSQADYKAKESAVDQASTKVKSTETDLAVMEEQQKNEERRLTRLQDEKRDLEIDRQSQEERIRSQQESIDTKEERLRNRKQDLARLEDNKPGSNDAPVKPEEPKGVEKPTAPTEVKEPTKPEYPRFNENDTSAQKDEKYKTYRSELDKYKEEKTNYDKYVEENETFNRKDAEYQEYQAKQSEYEKDLAKYNEEKSKYDAGADRRTDQMDRYEDRISSAQREIDDLETEINSEKRQLQNAKTDLTATETKIESRATEIEAIEGRMSGRSESIASKQGELEQNRSELARLETEKRELEQSRTADDKAVADKRSEIKAKETQIASQEGEIRALERENSNDQRDLAAMESDKSRLEGELASAKSDLDSKEASLKTLADGEKNLIEGIRSDERQIASIEQLRQDTQLGAQMAVDDKNIYLDARQDADNAFYQDLNQSAEAKVDSSMDAFADREISADPKEGEEKGETLGKLGKNASKKVDRKCKTSQQLLGKGIGYNCTESLKEAENWTLGGDIAEQGAAAYQQIQVSIDSNRALQKRSQASTIKVQSEAAERAAYMQYGMAAIRVLSAITKSSLASSHDTQSEIIADGSSQEKANLNLANRSGEIRSGNLEIQGDGNKNQDAGYIVGQQIADGSIENPIAASAVRNFGMNESGDLKTLRGCLDQKKIMEETRIRAQANDRDAAQQLPSAEANFQECLAGRASDYDNRRGQAIAKVKSIGDTASGENDETASELRKGSLMDVFKAVTAGVQGFGQQMVAKQLKDAANDLRAIEGNGTITVGEGDDLPQNENQTPFREGTPLPQDQNLTGNLAERDAGEEEDAPGFNPGANQEDPVNPNAPARFVSAAPPQSGGLGGGAGAGSPSSGLRGDLTQTDEAKAEYNSRLRDNYGGYSSGNGGGGRGDGGGGGRGKGQAIDPMAMLAAMMGKEDSKKEDAQVRFGSRDPDKDERGLAAEWNGLQTASVNIFQQVHDAYQIQTGLKEIGN